MNYVSGRSNLACTIFVPYDCKNNCPFCTSKHEYQMYKSEFSLKNIIESINKIGPLTPVKDFVITGGEPFADLEGLNKILNACRDYNKNIYINTTLPIQTDSDVKNIIQFLRENQYLIKGLNVSRHLSYNLTLQDDRLLGYIVSNLPISIRINCVLQDSDLVKIKQNDLALKQFIIKYTLNGFNISLRADYRKIKTQDDLRSLDYPVFSVLQADPNFKYLRSGGCMVCNNDDFIFRNPISAKETIVSIHRGFEHSLVKKDDLRIINDFIIKQNGDIRIDWDNESIAIEELYKSANWCF